MEIPPAYDMMPIPMVPAPAWGGSADHFATSASLHVMLFAGPGMLEAWV